MEVGRWIKAKEACHKILLHGLSTFDAYNWLSWYILSKKNIKVDHVVLTYQKNIYDIIHNLGVKA